MTTYTSRVTVALAVAVLAACGADRSTATRRYAVLSDARSDGAPGFYFLPPVAPEPASSTPNDAGLSPVVEIVALDASATVLARFEGDAIRKSGSHDMALWSTGRDAPVPGTTYRIRVLLDGKILGFADAQTAGNGRELRLLASNEVFGLTGSRSVPIKFRIQAGPPELCKDVVCGAPTQCQASVACDPATGACIPTAKPPAASCDDGNPCTTGDACDGEGDCLAGAGLVCPGADACNAPACDPAAGCVNHPAENGTNCTTSTGGAGYCLLAPALGRSVCMSVGAGKLSP
ncbi:MAG TPA: hypothetical protein VF841_04435 [Anaeromyxobacter sp.]